MAEEVENIKEEENPQENITAESDIQERLKELEKKLEACEDRYVRVHADFENIKKRLEREKYQALEYAYEVFARDLLPVFDSLELAIASAKNKEAATDELLVKLQEGIELTIDQFSKVFAKHGIEVIDIEQGFNPHFHEALMHIEVPGMQEGQIVQVFQKGYRYKGRVLRPSKVGIAKKSESEQGEE